MLRLLTISLCCFYHFTAVYAEDQAADSTQTESSIEQSQEIDSGVEFSNIPGCKQVDGQWQWTDGEHGFELVSNLATSIVVKTTAGNVRVKKSILSEEPKELITTLNTLIKQLEKATIAQSDKAFTYNDNNVTGLRLTRGKEIILPDGVLSKQAVENIDFDDMLKQLKNASESLIATLDNYKQLDKLGKSAIENVLSRLDWRDSDEEEFDAVPPSFARRVIRHKWLDTVIGESKEANEVYNAVLAAEKFHAVRNYSDGKNHLRQLENAFGQSIWVLQSDLRTVYTCAAPKPIYHFNADDFNRDIQLIVEIPKRLDPFDSKTDLSGCTRLVLEDRDTREILAQWENDTFSSDNQLWREYLKIGRKKVSNFVPPHITQVSLNGDIIKIVTPHGTLDALKDTKESSMEAFLNNAAETLTTPAYLDLIGQYMLTYVYDSPDSSIPHLIGSREINSDIHQTALQTLGTSCGGQFRGDCDDLSELYHNILGRQGKTPHVVNLPAHAAVAWAEEINNKWHTYVLQTGPALEFSADSLQKSLEKAYRHFDESDTFDPNGLGLLLRFSGENTRSGWRLSYRIFSEPEYAKTMIDVQRDWHFQTYQRAIHKMLKMIEDGDEDTANFRELSGLYSYTGQYAKAAEYHQMAIDRTPEASSKLYMAMELVQHLYESKQNEKAIAAAQDIYDHQLPDLQKELRGSDLTFALQMAGSLNQDEAGRNLAIKFLSRYASKGIATNLDRIIEWSQSDQFNREYWENARDIRQLRRLIKWYINTTASILQERGFDDIETNKNLRTLLTHVEDYIQYIAPLEQEEPDDVLAVYADIAESYLVSVDIKDLIKKVKTVSLPQNIKHVHTNRLSGLPQFNRDLPWIKLSVPFWWMQIAAQFAHNNEHIDKAFINECYQLAEEAYKQADKLGIAGAFTRKQIHYVRLVHALVNEDAKTISTLLAYVKDKNDKRLRDSTGQWIGDCARTLSLDWYAQVMDIWTKELDYKPKYYWIAWRAALNKAPKHALLVAERAAKRFKDDPAFVEEYEFMLELFKH